MANLLFLFASSYFFNTSAVSLESLTALLGSLGSVYLTLGGRSGIFTPGAISAEGVEHAIRDTKLTIRLNFTKLFT